MCVYLHTNFQVSNIILTSFRQGVILPAPPPTSKQTPKKSTQIRVKSTPMLLFTLLSISLLPLLLAESLISLLSLLLSAPGLFQFI